KTIVPGTSLLITNPMDKRAKAWDLARELQYSAHVEATAKVLFPVPPETTDKYFPRTAASLLAGVMLSFLHSKRLPNWTLRDVICATQSVTLLKEVLSWYPENRARIEQHLHRINDDVFGEIGNFADTYAPMAAYLADAHRRGDTFTLDEWGE